MKTTTSLLTFALGLGLMLPASQDAHASLGGVQHCRSADGTSVYTDKPCAFVGAAPASMSSDLNMRLASEASREPAAYSDMPDSDATLPQPAATRRSLASGCARSPTQLAMDIEGSLALGDVNRLAESWQWAGMTQAQALPVMKRLEQLSRARVQGAHYYDAQMGMGLQLASAGNAADEGRAGILQVSLGGDTRSRSLELNVERYAGCYFVHF
ncbi:hypothetical protein [Cognatilysobacter lacus]|uniref:DUF4124 domain-containing protein n=1 Tax=Cognatilysobacter lacus TaxID=1643323 RepID=A0A5D8Z5B1_9GAMM|nr:hypothetical protein [Lysobacter lacus]TZF90108.1 hypothetical protein FW784_06555 [Lysobacter lacus]